MKFWLRKVLTNQAMEPHRSSAWWKAGPSADSEGVLQIVREGKSERRELSGFAALAAKYREIAQGAPGHRLTSPVDTAF